MSDKVLENLQKERDQLIPTPPIGRIVLWYERGYVHADHAQPAVVTAVEGPGRVSVCLLAKSRGAIKTGVKYHKIEGATDARVQTTYRFGCWDYVEGEAPSKTTHADFQVHLNSISEREKAYKTRQTAESNRPSQQKATA